MPSTNRPGSRALASSTRTAVALLLALALGAVGRIAAAQESGASALPTSPAGAPRFLLGPPQGDGPVVVKVRFELRDINEINDQAETFEFTGVVTLAWHDPRQSFDPAVEGVSEKIFQGAYQFDEISPGWFPQLVLVNETGLYQSSGVVLRVQPDGSSTLIATLNAAAEANFNMRHFPFDRHRLDAVFEVLGFDRDEVRLEVDPVESNGNGHSVAIPQWAVTGVSLHTHEDRVSYAGRESIASRFTLQIDVRPESFYMSRLVLLPLAVITLLSFSVFWMDRSSLGDRISVSFIGILTGVAYQIVMSENLPRISYVTFIHGFLTISFATMCATVVINLAVGAMDKSGRTAKGDRIDRRCRGIFPLVYVALNTTLAIVAVGVVSAAE